MSAEGNKEAFEELIEASITDVAALTALELRLQTITASWSGPLRFKVIDLKRRLGNSLGSGMSGSPNAWGVPFGLPPPDGRPLHQYRLSTPHFSALENYLKGCCGSQSFLRPHQEALFVLWAAEWFRRGFTGGVRKWSDLGDLLGTRKTQAEWRTLADNGLRVWKVAPLRLNGATHRLLSLARQGGFPIRAIDGDGKIWASSYLQRLVGILLAESDPTADTAFLHAEALNFMIPETWCHADFYAVCGDLALAVLELRRAADVGGATSGLPASVWLDIHRPTWRDTLPFVIDGEAGTRLIDGLMKAGIVKGGSGAVRAVRILEKLQGSWQARVQFELNGRIKSETLSAFGDHWSRLRVFASTALAQYMPGELAIVEPGENGEWTAVGNSAAQRAATIPLLLPAEIELRGDGQRIGPPLLLPGGEPVCSPMLVCYLEVEENSCPTKMIVAGTSSGKYRLDPLYIVAPSSWNLAPSEDGEAVHKIEVMNDLQSLWQINRGAIISSPLGDRYRVLAGQPREQRDGLVLSGHSVSNCRAADHISPIICGKPHILLRDQGRERAPRSGEIWWRKTGDREWQTAASFKALGYCEFAWREAATGFLRDRQVAIFLPDDFGASIQSTGESVELQLLGWSAAVSVRPGVKVESDRWRFRTFGPGQATAYVSLEAAGSRSVELEVPLPHQAWITDWTGTPILARKRVALADMHRLVARSSGPCLLMAQLYDGKGRRVPEAEMRWPFDEELPLNGIRDDVSALLRPLGDLDAKVELTFDDGHEDYWFVCEFDIALEKGTRGYEPTKAIVDETARIVGRPLVTPHSEADFGSYGLPGQLNHRPIDIQNLKGTWLLYLRAAERVLTRPLLLAAEATGEVSQNLLGRAMAEPHALYRQDALDALCGEAEGDGSRSHIIVRNVIDLVMSLNGLPPSTFDILRLISGRPLLATRLLFEAGEHELGAILSLSDGLPFAWELIPRPFWERAARLRFETIFNALPETLPDRLTIAASTIAVTRTRIAEAEAAVAPLLNLPPPATNISDVAQSFMQRAGDRAESFAQSPFRPQLTNQLPRWQFSEIYWRALDAPCAAAMTAAGRTPLNPAQVRCIKHIARKHPRYFQQAFAAILQQH